jgi:hypothetical protein
MRNYSGGGRNTVPTPGTELPDITNPRDLSEKMSFYNILGHGMMSEDKQRVFLVPEDTWILFITRAGIPADKRKTGRLREVLDDFYFLREGETQDQWYERVYSAMRDGSLFRDILYGKQYTENFSIYEPGDLIQDLELQFINSSWPFMRLGIWKLPIRANVKTDLDTMNNVEEIIKYNPAISPILQNLEAYKTEYPAYTNGINKILTFLRNFHKISFESQEAFLKDADVHEALSNKKIGMFYKEFEMTIAQFVSKNRSQQDRFFREPENLLTYSPSVKENDFNSDLYTMLNENRLQTPFPLDSFGFQRHSEQVSRQKLLETSKYRFIVVDACRSLESPSLPEAAYMPRLALTRSMSGIARREICVTNLMQMTKNKFEALLRGKTLGASSVIPKLLAGQAVTLSDFEASLLGEKGSLRTFLEGQQFKQDDVVYVQPPGSKGYAAVVSDINVNANGKLIYKVITENDIKNVPASSVFANESNVSSLFLSRALESLQTTKLKAAMQSQEDKHIKAIVDKEMIPKLKELKEKVYKEKFFDRVQEIYGGIMNRALKIYSVKERVKTLVEKKGISKDTYVNIEEFGTNPNGDLGYWVLDGSIRKFYPLEEVESKEEANIYEAILKELPESQKFKRGSHVKFKDMTRVPYLNGRIGVIVNVTKDHRGVFYKVKTNFGKPGTNGRETTPSIQVIPVLPAYLEQVPDTTPTEFPKNTLALPTNSKSFQLNQKLINAERATIEKNVRNHPERYRNKMGGGSRQKTRRTKKSKKQRKTRRQ